MSVQQEVLGPLAGFVGGAALLILIVYLSRKEDTSQKVLYCCMLFALLSIGLRIYQLIVPE